MVASVVFADGFGRTTDTNTRITFPAADTIGIQPGTVEIARAVEDDVQDEFVVNEGSLDIDFRVESDTIDPAFKVDGATGATTIGGTLNTIGGYSDNSVAGIDTTFVDNDGNTITVSGGIITAKTAP